MGTIATTDGTEIFYEDWGSGQPIVFSHGWPLSADDWDTQMPFFLLHGFRVVAHDRPGHGRSTQTDGGHDMDHYADDGLQARGPLGELVATEVGLPHAGRDDQVVVGGSRMGCRLGARPLRSVCQDLRRRQPPARRGCCGIWPAWRAAKRPPKPPPMMSTRGRASAISPRYPRRSMVLVHRQRADH